MRHAPFGRPRHPLGTFPCGKVPRPPAGGRNLPQETDFLWMAKERVFTFFFCFSGDFASAEATKGLSGRPLETFGALLLERIGFVTKTRILVEGRGKTFLAFPCFTKGFASAEATRGLSARPLDPFGSYPPLPKSHLPVVFVHIDQKTPKQQTPLPCPSSPIPPVKI